MISDLEKMKLEIKKIKSDLNDYKCNEFIHEIDSDLDHIDMIVSVNCQSMNDIVKMRGKLAYEASRTKSKISSFIKDNNNQIEEIKNDIYCIQDIFCLLKDNISEINDLVSLQKKVDDLYDDVYHLQDEKEDVSYVLSKLKDIEVSISTSTIFNGSFSYWKKINGGKVK